MTTKQLKIIKGYDNNNVAFSAFILCSPEEIKSVNEAQTNNRSANQ